MKYLFSSIIINLLPLIFTDDSKALAIVEVKPEPIINKAYFSQRNTNDNPVPEEYRTSEFLTSISIVSIGVLAGTGKSIKYLKRKKRRKK